jgi:hypothetical protein
MRTKGPSFDGPLLMFSREGFIGSGMFLPASVVDSNNNVQDKAKTDKEKHEEGKVVHRD